MALLRGAHVADDRFEVRRGDEMGSAGRRFVRGHRRPLHCRGGRMMQPPMGCRGWRQVMVQLDDVRAQYGPEGGIAPRLEVVQGREGGTVACRKGLVQPVPQGRQRLAVAAGGEMDFQRVRILVRLLAEVAHVAVLSWVGKRIGKLHLNFLLMNRFLVFFFILQLLTLNVDRRQEGDLHVRYHILGEPQLQLLPVADVGGQSYAQQLRCGQLQQCVKAAHITRQPDRAYPVRAFHATGRLVRREQPGGGRFAYQRGAGGRRGATVGGVMGHPQAHFLRGVALRYGIDRQESERTDGRGRRWSTSRDRGRGGRLGGQIGIALIIECTK